MVTSVDDRDVGLRKSLMYDSYLIAPSRDFVRLTQGSLRNNRYVMPSGVPCDAMVASPDLISSGPICVHCKSNLALDSAGVELQKTRFEFVFWC